MSFDINSNFNKQANFTGVKFGENKPVLEVELNELQEIQNEARADIIRDSISSGFVKLGEIDYDYCSKNENQIKLNVKAYSLPNCYLEVGKRKELIKKYLPDLKSIIEKK